MEPIQHNIQEVVLHYKQPRIEDMPKILTSKDAEEVIRKVIDPNRIDHKEFFWVILINRSNSVLGVSRISEGTTSGTLVNIREIFQLVIKSNAMSIVLCHNHPSGNLKPSQADISLTRKIKECGQLFEVTVLDHIILTSDGYYSFVDKGMLSSLS